MDKNEKLQVCRLVAQAILIDGQVTDEEHGFLDRLMTTYGLTDVEKKDVRKRNIDDDAEAMAREIKGFNAKSELLTELASAAASDGRLSKSERELLTKIGSAIGVSADEMEGILMAVTA